MSEDEEEAGLLLDPGPLPMPKPGAQVFASREDWWYNACLHISVDQWTTYALGFRQLADLGVEAVGDRQGRKFKTMVVTDEAVYAVVFNYRQYLELMLKGLITAAERYLGEQGDLPTKTHNLQALWTRLRPSLEHIWPTEEHYDTVEDQIRQFCAVDATSEAFRYPILKDGQQSLPGLTHINLMNLKEIVDGISTLLEGSDIGIYEMQEAKWKMDAEARQIAAEMAHDMAPEPDYPDREYWT